MLTRRVFLLGAAASTLTACGRGGAPDPGPAPVDGCRSRTPDSLVGFSTVGGAQLSYEISGAKQSFKADPRFVERLDAWASDWVAESGLGALVGVSTYGAFVDKCNSWHAAGRAFDFAELTHEKGSVSCRYDVWGDDPAKLRSYWRLAASLSRSFTYTLAYPFNELHQNHIHIDNGVSGYGATAFSQESKSQVQLVQGIARHVFGLDCPENARYDDATRAAVRAVQRQLGVSRPLADADGWRDFLKGSASA